jgi:predicted methyltransferase
MEQRNLCKECKRKGVVLQPQNPIQNQLRKSSKPRKCDNPECDNYLYEEKS